MNGLSTNIDDGTSNALLAAHFSSLPKSADRAPADSLTQTAAPHKPSVLIVEDNPSTRILLVYMLKATYDVSAASGYDEALGLIREKAFDALVLDINLCEQHTGIDLLHTVREMPQYAEIPAIACTAYTSYGDRERLLACGFDLYVAKPFTKEHLHDALGSLLGATTRIKEPGQESTL